MIRLAAVGDVHFAPDCRGTLRPYLDRLPGWADAFLVAGDLTRHGSAREAEALAEEIDGLGVPVTAVLGNHDYHCGEEKEIADLMRQAGADVLDGDALTIDAAGGRLGLAGVKGFGGGFAGACGTEFGEPEMKAFVAHTRVIAGRLKEALSGLDSEHKIALLHYAPVEQTLSGERLELYPFLGSYLLGEAVDEAGADLVIHGHAHGGSEKGTTPGGVPVRNVAQPLIQRPYAVYCLGDGAGPA